MEFFQWRPHPWHGLDVGANSPNVVNVYLEITPFDSMKYEVDKITGYLRIDRPQVGSSLPPCSYGFIPRTYSGDRVAAISKTGKPGDEDPIDVFLFSEPPISRAEIVVAARILGGICMLDEGQVDDKLIGVLENDPVWSDAQEVTDLPEGMIARIRHYLSTYKLTSETESRVRLKEAYGAAHARQIVEAGMADYVERYGPPSSVKPISRAPNASK